MTENEHVNLGAYHTLEIEQQRAFTIYKHSWDALDLERIQQACDPAASADLAAVLITACPNCVCVDDGCQTRLQASVLCCPALSWSSDALMSNTFDMHSLGNRLLACCDRSASSGRQ